MRCSCVSHLPVELSQPVRHRGADGLAARDDAERAARLGPAELRSKGRGRNGVNSREEGGVGEAGGVNRQSRGGGGAASRLPTRRR